MTVDEIVARLTSYEMICLKQISFRATVPNALVHLGLVEVGAFSADGEFHPVWKSTELGDKVQALHQAAIMAASSVRPREDLDDPIYNVVLDY